MTCASYATTVAGLDAAWATPLAVGAIVPLTIVNMFGVAPGAITQNVATVPEAGRDRDARGSLRSSRAAVTARAIERRARRTDGGRAGGSLPSVPALVPVLFAFGGWQQTNFVAEEMRNPARDLPRALVLGVLIVVLAYLLVNLAYLRDAGRRGARSEPCTGRGYDGSRLRRTRPTAHRRGHRRLDVRLPEPRDPGDTHASIRRWRRTASSSPRWHACTRGRARPSVALLGQAIWAIVLLFSGSYGQLLDYVVFADWLFFGATAATLFVYRAREARGAIPRVGVRALGHPISTALFLAAAVFVVLGSIASNPSTRRRARACWRSAGRRISGGSGGRPRLGDVWSP